MAAGDDVVFLPADLKQSIFKGFIKTPEHSYEVKVSLPLSNQISGARVEGDWRLSNMMRGQEEVLEQYITESNTVLELLVKMRELLTQQESVSPTHNTISLPLNVCQQLAKDIDSLGWSRVKSVDTLLRHIKLIIFDEQDRTHTLTVTPTPQYPEEPPTLIVDAPLIFKPRWDKKTALVGLVEQFSQWLSRLEAFWSCLEEVDLLTCVLEPEHPSRSHTQRRIMIDTHLSVVINVNPLQPLSLPSPLGFLGPDHRVMELKKKVAQNSVHWNVRQYLLANLQSLLELKFPKPSSKEAAIEMSDECAMCYEYRLDGSVPSVICSNQQCSKHFHRECFEEWLRGSHRLHKLLSGDCPFCGQMIALRSTNFLIKT